ncbi:hypothetical protein FZEAL_2863 [Fusarium zealandicum]|uniref:RING-type domain-containing protein n=1 Tax=Fusarium zealandicum TaxID=1053134 RepID=A0A8H4UPW2_9HYPO|nr:hypothetical protein FZEAL_2863 [Fusarium zealandicum]
MEAATGWARDKLSSIFRAFADDSQPQVSPHNIDLALNESEKASSAGHHHPHRLLAGIGSFARNWGGQLSSSIMYDDNEVTDQTSQRHEDACIQAVTALFPDICLDYLKSIAQPRLFISDDVINHIIDLEESGRSYTKKPKEASRKRKRDDEEEDPASAAKRKYDNPLRLSLPKHSFHMTVMKKMIAGDFPRVPMKTIQKLLSDNGHLLLPTFLALNETILTAQQEDADPPWKWKKSSSPLITKYSPEHLDVSIENCIDPDERGIMEELRAAREVQDFKMQQIQDRQEAKDSELRNMEEAMASGEVAECQCCFVEFPLNRLIHCDGDSMHLFCVDCARRNAETQIGLSKYELECMSTEGCQAGFCLSERQKFLDEKLTSALDRIEQEAVLRMAGLKDLATCPFCPYAAEYPPIKDNREFTCLAPHCGIVSCRLCSAESHIPKSCEEVAREKGIDMRREVEEAMTAALIRICNKCQTPFIKESGCNKMTCTRRGCGNIQCYVCSKSCAYSHFNDVSRGGKKGNCPLFDCVEDRHETDIKKAEEAARKKVLEEHPELDPELLKFAMSNEVSNDDALRKNQDPYVNQDNLYINGVRVDIPGQGWRRYFGRHRMDEPMDGERGVHEAQWAALQRRAQVNIDRDGVDLAQFPDNPHRAMNMPQADLNLLGVPNRAQGNQQWGDERGEFPRQHAFHQQVELRRQQDLRLQYGLQQQQEWRERVQQENRRVEQIWQRDADAIAAHALPFRQQLLAREQMAHERQQQQIRDFNQHMAHPRFQPPAPAQNGQLPANHNDEQQRPGLLARIKGAARGRAVEQQQPQHKQPVLLRTLGQKYEGMVIRPPELGVAGAPRNIEAPRPPGPPALPVQHGQQNQTAAKNHAMDNPHVQRWMDQHIEMP